MLRGRVVNGVKSHFDPLNFVVPPVPDNVLGTPGLSYVKYHPDYHVITETVTDIQTLDWSRTLGCYQVIQGVHKSV